MISSFYLNHSPVTYRQYDPGFIIFHNMITYTNKSHKSKNNNATSLTNSQLREPNPPSSVISPNGSFHVIQP